MSTQQLVSPDGLTANVASEIRAAMGRLRISRSEMARRLGVDDTWVGKRLNGRTEIGLSDLERIAQALGVEIIDLLPRAVRGAEPTLTFTPARQDPPAMIGNRTPWPADHPVLAGSVPLPPRRVGGPPPSPTRTSPTGR